MMTSTTASASSIAVRAVDLPEARVRPPGEGLVLLRLGVAARRPGWAGAGSSWHARCTGDDERRLELGDPRLGLRELLAHVVERAVRVGQLAFQALPFGRGGLRGLVGLRTFRRRPPRARRRPLLARCRRCCRAGGGRRSARPAVRSPCARAGPPGRCPRRRPATAAPAAGRAPSRARRRSRRPRRARAGRRTWRAARPRRPRRARRSGAARGARRGSRAAAGRGRRASLGPSGGPRAR